VIAKGEMVMNEQQDAAEEAGLKGLKADGAKVPVE
jgi:hypothetical protein